MTRAQILALPIRENTRIYQASDTLELFIIIGNKPVSEATVLPDPAKQIDRDDMQALLRTDIEGDPDLVTQSKAVLTFGANPEEGQEVDIGGYVYKFVATPLVSHDVRIGANIAASITNLASVINIGNAFDGAPNPLVTATAGPTSLTVTAIASGTQGDGIVLTETLGTEAQEYNDSFWETPTTQGGIDALVSDIIGMLCRVGDAPPYVWHLWCGTFWEKIGIQDTHTHGDITNDGKWGPLTPGGPARPPDLPSKFIVADPYTGDLSTVDAGSSASFNYTQSNTAPLNPNPGDKWFNTTTKIEYVFYGGAWLATAGESDAFAKALIFG